MKIGGYVATTAEFILFIVYIVLSIVINTFGGLNSCINIMVKNNITNDDTIHLVNGKDRSMVANATQAYLKEKPPVLTRMPLQTLIMALESTFNSLDAEAALGKVLIVVPSALH